MSDVHPLSGTSGLFFDLPVSSLVFLPITIALSCHFSANGPFAILFSRKFSNIFFLNRN